MIAGFGNRVVVVAIAVVGAILILVALSLTVGVRNFVRTAQRSPGIVVALNAGGSHPQVRFVTNSGAEISYPQGGIIFGYRVGDIVEVLYTEDDPRGSATISARGALWATPLFLGAMGAIFAAVAAFRLIMSSSD